MSAAHSRDGAASAPTGAYDIVLAAFVAVLLISNVASTKILVLGPFTFDAGTILFPLSYIFGTVLTEVYGFRRARRVIWTGFAAMAFMALVLARWSGSGRPRTGRTRRPSARFSARPRASCLRACSPTSPASSPTPGSSPDEGAHAGRWLLRARSARLSSARVSTR